MAEINVARALSVNRDQAESTDAFRRFLTIWKEADPSTAANRRGYREDQRNAARSTLSFAIVQRTDTLSTGWIALHAEVLSEVASRFAIDDVFE